jgi:hypothetical protein
VGTGAVGAVVAGGVVVVAAVVGGCTAGSDFSPQPAAARATGSASPIASACSLRLAFAGGVTAGTLTEAHPPRPQRTMIVPFICVG